MGIQEKSDGRTVMLKRVRLSFTDTLHTADNSVEDGPKKFGCNLIIEADSSSFAANKAAVISALRSAADKAKKSTDLWKTLVEDDPKRCCFRKGSRFKNGEGQIYAGYEGNMAITGSGPKGGKNRPKLLDRHKRPVETDDIMDVCYGGVYGDAVVSFYFTDKGGQGLFCSIDAIRSHQEGDAQGGGGIKVDADDFDDLDDDDSFGGGSDDDDLLGDDSPY